jgi:hypothetical protein
MQPESFKKGDLFEKFVENELFKASDYVLVSRTNSYDQNKNRYAEDTLRPDFKFRCKKTGQEFYVEAKYRSRFNAENKLEVISYTQIERFKGIQKEESIPIFIAIGYGGSPENPDSVSLIPLEKLSYLELYPSFLKRFNVEKGAIDHYILNLPITQRAAAYKRSPKSQGQQPVPSEIKAKLPIFKNKKIMVAIGMGFVLVAFLLFKTFNTSIEDTLKQKTAAYYTTIHSGNIDGLEDFISPRVDKWYSRSDLTFSEIKEDTKRYIKRHPLTSTNIQWDTFKFTPLNDSYSVSYNMVYKLLRENKGRDIIFHLKIHVVWDKDLKITSMYEEGI